MPNETNESQHHDGGRLKPDEFMQERARAAVEATAAPPKNLSPNSLQAKRQRKATAYAREVYEGIAGAAQFRSGQYLSPADVDKLVDEFLSEENVPASLKAEVRKTARGIVQLKLDGDGLKARVRAQEEAQHLGKALIASTWEPKQDDFDAAAMVARIPRS